MKIETQDKTVGAVRERERERERELYFSEINSIEIDNIYKKIKITIKPKS